MAEEFTGTITAPALAKLVDLIGRFTRNDAKLRAEQARNAEQSVIERNITVTAGAAMSIVEAQETDYTAMVIVFDETAQKGRYSLKRTPTADGAIGLPIPAGGGAIEITGPVDIRNFRVIAQSGGTLPGCYVLFR